METCQVNYKGRLYHIADVTLFEGTDEEMTTCVAEEEFEKALLDENFEPVDDRASAWDEMIAYYIPSEDLLRLPYEDIVKIVEKSYEDAV